MRTYIASILILLVCVLIFILLPNDANNSIYTKLNIVSLIGTFFVVGWYTIETYVMQTRIKEQIDISVMPSLALWKNGIGTLELANVGNGTACNIKFDDIIISDNGIFVVKLKVNGALFLQKNDRVELDIISFRNDTLSGTDYSSHLDQRYSKNQYNVSVSFEDVLHRRYCQKISLGIEGPSIGVIVKE